MAAAHRSWGGRPEAPGHPRASTAPPGYLGPPVCHGWRRRERGGRALRPMGQGAQSTDASGRRGGQPAGAGVYRGCRPRVGGSALRRGVRGGVLRAVSSVLAQDRPRPQRLAQVSYGGSFRKTARTCGGRRRGRQSRECFPSLWCHGAESRASTRTACGDAVTPGPACTGASPPGRTVRLPTGRFLETRSIHRSGVVLSETAT
jgi:hypothetical protein